ncbi:MAG TPA: nucleoside kinase [Candidatus Fimimorpha excrementavium]|nr:nucleoside kinase [Candidatus Fimimorpha excrementavium]
MVKITINGTVEKYPEGTKYLDIAKKHQKEYENDIVLVKNNGKLRELFKSVGSDAVLEFVTTKDKIGMDTYRRSSIHMMLKAFYDVAGADMVQKVRVHFSISNAIYCEVHGMEIGQELLDRVKARMLAIVEERMPIEKKSMNTEKAIARFRQHRMYDKERLFSYRRVSRVNLYRIGEFEDYYYGYMVPDTGYLRYFDLALYERGFVLKLPIRQNPTQVAPFVPQSKLYQTLRESTEWGDRMEISTVGQLNDMIANGKSNELILIQEALMEKKIAEIAEDIIKSPGKKFVMIAGPSSSGKTTFSHRLSIQLKALGLKPHPIAVDDYFVNREDSPKDEYGNYNYEDLECIDVRQFNADMNRLLSGEVVEMPEYNFISGKREYKGKTLHLGKEDILVIEGIHCLNDALTPELSKESKYKIYISALTQLNIDEHNRIPTTDGRLIRRIVRDARTRGNSARETLKMWNAVRKGEEKNIFPYQETADAMFNSALIYELAVLKIYAEPLLFQIKKGEPEYQEAKKLLKFFDYFLGIPGETIPQNSLIREFIGGSCFKV